MSQHRRLTDVDRPVSPAPAQSLLTRTQWQSIAKSLHLSGREIQIVQHIFDDHKELAIAQNLGISPHTVHTHLERLYHKLDVASRAGLIIRVFTEACQQCQQQKGADGC